MYTKISLTEFVNGLVLLMLPIYFNALERTTVFGITGYLSPLRWNRLCNLSHPAFEGFLLESSELQAAATRGASGLSDLSSNLFSGSAEH